ncbi:MAG: recombinase family protein [Bacteroidales bacterium]|nr:recombinase family protein [Bacteroidales bacterium]
MKILEIIQENIDEKVIEFHKLISENNSLINNTLHVYVRVSTKTQTEGTSIENQIEEGKKIVKREPNIENWIIWNEEGKSSSKPNLSFRPVYMNLLEEIKNGRVKNIYVLDLSRQSRDDEVSHTAKVECRKQGVIIYTESGSKYNLNNPEDELIYNVISSFWKYENLIRRKKSIWGKIRSVRDGKWIGGTYPFGYKVDESGRLIIDERYEKIIQRIFEGYGNGKLSVTQIRDEFLKQNIPTQRGKKLWNLGTFQRMFREGNVYNGHIEYTFKETGDKITLTTPKIISDEVWDKVQDRVHTIKVIKNQIRKNKNKYLLLPVKQSPYNHSILFCGHCGERMGGRTIAHKNEHFYYCLSKQRKWRNPDVKVCIDNRSINIHRTNGLIWETLLNVRKNSHLIRDEFKKQLLDDKFQNDKNRKLSIRSKEGTKRKKERELKGLESNIDKLYEEKYLNKINNKRFDKLLLTVNNEIGKLKTEILSIEDSISQLNRKNEWIEWVDKFHGHIETLKNVSDQKKKEEIFKYINRIDVRYDKVNKEHKLTITFSQPIVNDKLIRNLNHTSPYSENFIPRFSPSDGEDKIDIIIKEKKGRNKKSDDGGGGTSNDSQNVYYQHVSEIPTSKIDLSLWNRKMRPCLLFLFHHINSLQKYRVDRV